MSSLIFSYRTGLKEKCWCANISATFSQSIIKTFPWSGSLDNDAQSNPGNIVEVTPSYIEEGIPQTKLFTITSKRLNYEHSFFLPSQRK